MRKRKKPTLDAKSWAKETPAAVGGNKCRLCAAVPAVGKDIKTIVEMRNKGETNVSYRQVVDFLNRKHGIKTNESSLYDHLRKHMGLKW